LALDVAPAEAGGADALWIVLGAGKGRARGYALLRLDAAGAQQASVSLKDVKTDPQELLVADLDRDGRNDALMCLPTELPRILLAQPDGSFRDVDVAQQPGLGLLKGLARDALDWADVDGDGRPELLVPGPSFARAFHLDAGGRPVVVAQFNLPDPGAQVACAAALDLDGDGRPEVALADRSQKALYLLRRDAEGASEVAARADLQEFVPRALRALGPGRLLLLAPDRVGRVTAESGDATFLPDLEFEVPVKDAYVNDLCLADVNGDGTSDLVLTETRRHELVIARVGPEALDFALRFPVYDERLFESGRSGQEPREVVAAELTGDGLTDIAILVHDRLIVYPQEPAP
ncbi:MAG: VCBS repeat-containing protein, partial [Planctomycetes bacterium]|nr:VCBS repeat-containing protein [Planctomycetota bacterium]